MNIELNSNQTCKQINKPENICLKFCPLTSKKGSGRLDSEKRNNCENRGFAKSVLKLIF